MTSRQMLQYAIEKKRPDRVPIDLGGIDIQQALIGSIDEIQLEAKERIRVLGENGGCVLSPAHNIQADTPPENIVELYRLAGELRYE